MHGLIDGIAVDIDEFQGINYTCRLQNFNDIRKICPGLIEAVHMGKTSIEENSTLFVQIIHFSIQEYLESDRILCHNTEKLGLSGVTAHAEIAETCLTYLLELGHAQPELDSIFLKNYPLARYAAEY